MRFHSKLLAATAILAAVMTLPAAAQAADAIAQHSGTLRAGPGSDFPEVDHISSGDSLQVYGCTDGYDWCDVSDGDNRGWFPGSRIAYMRDGSEEILPEVATVVGIGIVGFAVDEYWGAHYHSRPWFNREHYFVGHYHGPGPGFHNPGGPIIHNNIVIQNGHPVHPQVGPHVNNNVVIQNGNQNHPGVGPHFGNPVVHNNNNPVLLQHNNNAVHNVNPVIHNNNGFHPNVVHNNAPHVNVQHGPICPNGKCH
jgi:uncharacterized protein YraI